ncbi:MAG: NAD(P)-binding protein [Neisseria sp.]|nr:NAD(P)-binding protein [Neisseria sp.]
MFSNRRRFLLYSSALAAACIGSRMIWQGLNSPPPIRVNRAGLPLGHILRNGGLDAPDYLPFARCGTLVLGSGAAGLSAVWYLAKHNHVDVLLAEGLERNGNNAAFRYRDIAAPCGAHYLALPSKESIYVREMLHDLGIMSGDSFNEEDLVFAPQERLLYQGGWLDGLLPHQDGDIRRFSALAKRLKNAKGRDGRRFFVIPVDECSQDDTWRRLDKITFAQWLEQEGYRSETLLWYLDYCCRDDYGQGIGQVSAFAGLHYFCARGHQEDTVLTWPEGLAHLSEGLRRISGLHPIAKPPEGKEWRFARPAAWNAAAVKIKETDGGVFVWLRDNSDGETRLVLADKVICAMPLMVASRVAEGDYGLPQPVYAPWLVGNFVLHRFPEEKGGSHLAWDNVVYGSGQLGYVAAGNQLIRVAKPERTVFTAYAALNHGSPGEIRRWLMRADEAEFAEFAAQDLLAAYGGGFWHCVEAVDLTVRGHAMSVPRPGYLSDASLLRLRRHDSRLLFAHSDLSGYSVFEEAVYWGVKAARKVLRDT